LPRANLAPHTVKISDLTAQTRFFADEKNQYRPELVLRPPYHTARELGMVLRTLRDLPAGRSVADFGAGTGRLTVPLLRMGHSVCAIDVSEESLERLRRLAEGIPTGSLTTAPGFAESQLFAAIVGTDILHHVEMDTYLPRIRDALEPGGRVAFSEPGGFNPTWYVYLSLLGWNVEKGFMNGTIRNLTRALTKHGFEGVTITGIGLLPRPFFNPVPRLGDLNDAAGNLPVLRQFAYRYIVEARRG
jgi:2-polyprenyl-3-methyl-5-hydroxy-6-metoxy-1,4-benzoquinol methylase